MERKVHPRGWTYDNIATMRQQLKLMGLSLDWSREIATCDPDYYQHQQRMFLDFLKAGLVERKQSKVNWDPVDHTVLANEQVIEGRGWRSGALVEQRELTQWFFKITAYSRGPAGRDRHPRPLARQGPRHAEQLDRPLRGPAAALRARRQDDARRRERTRRLHDAAGHFVRRELRRHFAGPSAGHARWPRRIRRSPPSSSSASARHRAGADRDRRETRLRHRHPRRCIRSIRPGCCRSMSPTSS